MRAFLPWVLILLGPSALADLYSAQIAYEKGDFDRAFQDYRELAERVSRCAGQSRHYVCQGRGNAPERP